MLLSLYSFITAVLWCSFFSVMIYALLRRNQFILSFGIQSVLVLVVLTLLRLIVHVEFSFTRIFRSYVIFPAINGFCCLAPFAGISDVLSFTIADMLIAVWITGSGYCLVKLIRNEYKFRKLMSDESVTQDMRILSIWSGIAKEKSSKLQIVVTNKITVPLISGLYRPVIYLPDYPLSDKEAHSVLLHEWTHYQHRDLWTTILIHLLCAVFWWNPFIYLLKRDIDKTLEIHSDLSIANGMGEEEKLEYLQSILNIARRVQKTSVLSSACTLCLIPKSRDSLLKQRMELVLKHHSSGPARNIAAALLTLFMLLVYAGTYLFVLQPNGGPPEEAQQGLAFAFDFDTMYLVESPDGTFALYDNDTYVGPVLYPDEEPLSLLPKKKSEKEGEQNEDN